MKRLLLLILIPNLFSVTDYSQCNGTAQFTNSGQNLGVLNNLETPCVSLGDLDGDGDVDAYIGRTGSSWNDPNRENEVWFNDGTGIFSNSGQLLGNSGTDDVSLGDVDGDGDLDAIDANFYDTSNLYYNIVWLNNGSGFFSAGDTMYHSDYSYGAPLGDLDGDGDLDIFSIHGSNHKIWFNDGNGDFSISSQIPSANIYVNDVKLADFDGDNDLDACISSWNNPNEIWFNDGNGSFTNSYQNLGDANGCDIADLDGDGDLDIYFVASSSSKVWINDGNGFFTNNGQNIININGQSVALSDLEGDGDIDAFIINYNAGNEVLINDGTGNFINSGQSLGSQSSYDIALADLDGDLDIDAFICNYDHHNTVWFNDISFNCDNLSIKNHNIYLPKYFSKPYVTAQNSSQLDVQPGAWVNNIGANNQSNISLTSKIYFNNNVLYNQTSSSQNINAGDSVFFSFPIFNQSNYQQGNYAIEYSINMNSGIVDDDTSNNQITSSFIFNDTLFSYSRLDPLTNGPIANKYENFPSVNQGYLGTCIHLYDSTFNYLRPKGVTLSYTYDQDLTGEYVSFEVYELLDQFSNMYNYQNWSGAMVNADLLTYGQYVFSSDLQAQNIYIPFDSTISLTLEGNKRYAFCAVTFNQQIKVGWDTVVNYNQNFASLYNQPISSVSNSVSTWFTYPNGQNVPAFSINFNENLCDNPSFVTITDTVCGEYVFNGNIYSPNDTLTTHTVTLSDYQGCDSTVTYNVWAYNDDFPIAFQANPTAGNTPLIIIFDNQTPNLSNYNFTWSFGDGSIVQNNGSFVSHTYQSNGTWDVALIAENIFSGCVDTLIKNGYVFSAGGNPCNHSATINQTGPINACLSDSMFLSCNTSLNFTFQWQLNGFPVSGATDSLFYPTQSGSYNVVVTENNCPVFSSSIQVSIITITTPTITASGTLLPCLGGTVTLSVPNIYSSFNWSSGGTSSSEFISSSGTYFVTVSNAAGCEATSPAYTINASFATPPDVCIVGVDTLTNYNKVVWEKPISTAIDSFYVYKETNQANIYQKIGGTAYSDTAVFNDLSSNPAIQAYRYKLSLVDSCGVESSLGSMHKSMHLTINQGVGTAWNLIWSHYEGFTFPSYNIYRGTSSTNMTLLTTIASNLNSYTDLSAPSGQLYYQIEVVSNYTCDPLKSTYNTSRSNVVDNAQAPSIIVQNQNSDVKLFPNPTKDQITIDIKGYTGPINVKLYDIQGRILQTVRTSKVSLREYAKGIYILKVSYGDITEEVRVVRD